MVEGFDQLAAHGFGCLQHGILAGQPVIKRLRQIAFAGFAGKLGQPAAGLELALDLDGDDGQGGRFHHHIGRVDQYAGKVGAAREQLQARQSGLGCVVETQMVDGNDGLVAARNKPYDLIILDIMLPEQRGDQILDALRNDAVDLVPNSKFLVMTNFEQNDRDRETMLKRVDGYLIKADITPRRLLEVIEELGRS